MMMMMITPNSPANQKKGVYEEGEEEAGDQRKGGQTGTPTSDADVPTGLSQSGVLGARIRRKHGRWYGVLLRRKGRCGQGFVLRLLGIINPYHDYYGIIRDYSHDRNGGSYEKDERSWERVVLQGRGRFASSAAICGNTFT